MRTMRPKQRGAVSQQVPGCATRQAREPEYKVKVFDLSRAAEIRQATAPPQSSLRSCHSGRLMSSDDARYEHRTKSSSSMYPGHDTRPAHQCAHTTGRKEQETIHRGEQRMRDRSPVATPTLAAVPDPGVVSNAQFAAATRRTHRQAPVAAVGACEVRRRNCKEGRGGACTLPTSIPVAAAP